jgi:hypothetical protein
MVIKPLLSSGACPLLTGHLLHVCLRRAKDSLLAITEAIAH